MAEFNSQNTISRGNKACINCPIFDVEVPLRSCFALHEKFMKGERPEVRKGCQAAMASNKCPVWHILHDMRRTGSDPYFASEKRRLQLKPSTLERIAPIIVSPNDLENYAVPLHERERIEKCGSRPAKSVTDPVHDGERPTRKRKSAPAAKPDTPSDTVTAANKGDMGAALNKAMETSQ